MSDGADLRILAQEALIRARESDRRSDNALVILALMAGLQLIGAAAQAVAMAIWIFAILGR